MLGILLAGVILLDPGCAGGEEWDGERCVAVQLPGETNGRAIDCPDGSIGYMQDGRGACPVSPPVVIEPAPGEFDPCFRQDIECYDVTPPVVVEPPAVAEPPVGAPEEPVGAPGEPAVPPPTTALPSWLLNLLRQLLPFLFAHEEA